MDNAPETKPQIAFGKPAKFFQYEIPNTPNRHGHNLVLDVEYSLDSTDANPACHIFPVVETISINGHEVSHFLEQVGGLSDLQEKIEAAILAKLSDL